VRFLSIEPLLEDLGRIDLDGIAWAIVGKLDRPWFERPIFGQVRYMSSASTGKKFDSEKYIAQHSRKEPSFKNP